MKYWSNRAILFAEIFAFGIGIGGRAEAASFPTDVLPVLEHNCTTCHGAKKQKASLRLDSYGFVLRGSEDGAVIEKGNAQDSEVYRRILLPPGDDDFMPRGNKPPLSAHDIELVRQWIVSGAPQKEEFDVPAFKSIVVFVAAAPDYRPRLKAAQALAGSIGVRLVPRSSVPTDGLVLRTASAPGRCTDTVIAQLSPYSDLIVDAELARTRISSKSLDKIGSWKNLMSLDISFTRVSSESIDSLTRFTKLEVLNVSGTQIDQAGIARLQALTGVKHLFAFIEAPTPPKK